MVQISSDWFFVKALLKKHKSYELTYASDENILVRCVVLMHVLQSFAADNAPEEKAGVCRESFFDG